VALKIVYKVLRMWRKYVADRMLLEASAHERIKQNALLLSYYVFRMKGDIGQAARADALLLWKRGIVGKRRALKFVGWSLSDPKPRAVRRWFLDICFGLVKHRASCRYDSLPFKTDEATKLSIRRKSSCDESKHAVNAARTTVTMVNGAVRRLHKFPRAPSDWHVTASSEDVRDLFFRLVIAVARRFVVQRPQLTKRQIKQHIKRFRDENNLVTIEQIRYLRTKQNRQSDKLCALRRLMEHRDNDLLNGAEAHEAASQMCPVVRNFSVGEKPRRLFELEIDSVLPESVPEVPPIDHQSREADLHPLLADVVRIRSELMADNRARRREPEVVFQRTQNIRGLLLGDDLETSSGSPRATGGYYGYESHQSVTGRHGLSEQLASRDFTISQLANLKSRAKTTLTLIQEGIRLRKISSHSPPLPAPVHVPPVEAIVPQLETQTTNNVLMAYALTREYFLRSKKDRVNELYGRFLSFLNFLLYGSSGAFEQTDLLALHNRVCMIIYRLCKKRGEPFPYRKQLPPDYLATLFVGQSIIPSGLTVHFHGYGLNRLKSWIASAVKTKEDLIAVKDLMTATVRGSGGLAEREALEQVTVSIDEHQKELEEGMKENTFITAMEFERGVTVQQKWNFVEDVASVVVHGAFFLTEAVSLYYPKQQDVDPFEGIDELRDEIGQRMAESPVVLPVIPKPKPKMRFRKTFGGHRKTGPRKKGRSRVDSPVIEDLLIPCPESRNIEQGDMDFFMLVVPHIVPCKLMVMMIREERQKAMEMCQGGRKVLEVGRKKP
jgi:hypothetical protein